MSFIAFCFVEFCCYYLLSIDHFGGDQVEVFEIFPDYVVGFLLAPIGPIFVTAVTKIGPIGARRKPTT